MRDGEQVFLGQWFLIPNQLKQDLVHRHFIGLVSKNHRKSEVKKVNMFKPKSQMCISNMRNKNVQRIAESAVLCYSPALIITKKTVTFGNV